MHAVILWPAKTSLIDCQTKALPGAAPSRFFYAIDFPAADTQVCFLPPQMRPSECAACAHLGNASSPRDFWSRKAATMAFAHSRPRSGPPPLPLICPASRCCKCCMAAALAAACRGICLHLKCQLKCLLEVQAFPARAILASPWGRLMLS